MKLANDIHDLDTGPVTRCQVCGSENLEEVLDLGHQPLSDSLPSKTVLAGPETSYPLRQLWCRDCTLSQLDYIVPSGVVYHPEYPYRSGITKELAEYQRALAGEAIDKLGLQLDNLVIDIGSNDGTLLSGFKMRNMRVLGVEPTNIAQIANADGIETLQSFFGEETARQIRESHGPAKLITATNVFAHMATLGPVMRGIKALLDDDGVFMLENHYLVEIMRGGQFDTIYHEHLRSYSLKALTVLFEMYGMTVFSARQVARYGGNIRVYVCREGQRSVESSVAEILKLERDFGLDDPACYARFRDQARTAKRALVDLAYDCDRKGLSFVGNSCPARASTLLNYCGIGTDLMPYIAEQPTSLKLGLHLPGMHQPIVENSILIEQQPDYVVLLAWHYWKPISDQLRDRGLKSKMVVPLPEIQVLEP